MKHAVSIEGLSHRYDRVVALEDIGLQILQGSRTGFIGPDAAGKSTLLSLIAGVRRIQTGTVRVFGQAIDTRRQRELLCPRIAYMPQGLGRNLYMGLSVHENIDFFGRLFGLSSQARAWRIEELLAATGLAGFAQRAAGKLSGGMKQKLSLCCALVHDPELLILDEPTTGVDPLSRQQFWKLLSRLQQRRPGMTVLVATAYMEEAEGFDCLVAMDEGRILASGTPQQLKAATATGNLGDAFVELMPEEKRRGYKRQMLPGRGVSTERAVAIQARGLTRRFGDFTAVDHVDFTIVQGEIFGFLGSNGCGKTTTMKMLTGLLPASAGTAVLFGTAVDSHDLSVRRRVGYMSQSFSLYGELSVRRNLLLHAQLFHLQADRIASRVDRLLQDFGLDAYRNETASRLPLGLRQRLSLAVAVVHEPEMLILDEPTSGVDPVARDLFWGYLLRLSREQGVTIFVSTHFMNEAERCDRIAFMHAGRVLATGTPQELLRSTHSDRLEDAFIHYLRGAGGQGAVPADEHVAYVARAAEQRRRQPAGDTAKQGFFSMARLAACAIREMIELRRDPVRMAFALLGPLLLLIVFGYGISFDVEHLPYAVLDRDRTPDSRAYLENFAGSRYFDRRAPLSSYRELEQRLRSGELRMAVEIPPAFGRHLHQQRSPVVAVWLDGAVPFRAETARAYVFGVHRAYLQGLADRRGRRPPAGLRFETRFRYNQAFKSVYAMVPGIVMILLVLIPAMMTAVAVVREKESGSILNLYATPVSRLEFLLGKQLPYVLVAMLSYFSMLLVALLLFHVPVKGSFPALTAGALLYVIAATGLGLLVSAFVRSQIAAIFAAAIFTIIPAINFSGFFAPVSSLSGNARVVSMLFPGGYFQNISLGAFTKALSASDLLAQYLALGLIIIVVFCASLALLNTQER